MKVYIAGPMTGLPEFNFPAFNAAAKAWRSVGWEVLNPAESFEGRTDLAYREYVAHDMKLLREVNAIALLPGWDGPGARGSVWEREVAILLGKRVLDASIPLPPLPPEPPETICAEADRLVNGPRRSSYGHPIEDYTRTGRMWGAILGIPDIDPRICTLMMAAVKVSREVHAPKRDNRVDLAGYAACADLIAQKQNTAA